MAWGYWSAATVSDRARSPRRNTSTSFASVSHFASSLPSTSIIPPPPAAPAYHRPQHVYGHLQQHGVPYPQHQHQQHHQPSCYNHNSNVGSGSDDDYPPVTSTLSRRPSFADIEFTGPVPAGRPLTLLLDGASTSRPPSAMNTYPRAYHHHHHHHAGVSTHAAGSMTAATSTNALYIRSSMRRGDARETRDCIIHQPIIHHHQCFVHKTYASDDDDEPDPAYATGTSRIDSVSIEGNTRSCQRMLKLRK